ncbi:CG32447 CG32447PBlike, partial [Caligus rogercresseyi]
QVHRGQLPNRPGHFHISPQRAGQNKDKPSPAKAAPLGLCGNNRLLLNNQMLKKGEEEYLSTIPRRSVSEQRYSRSNPNVTFRRSSEMNN